MDGHTLGVVCLLIRRSSSSPRHYTSCNNLNILKAKRVREFKLVDHVSAQCMRVNDSVKHDLFVFLGRHFSSVTSKTFMHGNIDHMEQPEEYHKMAVPGTL